MKVAVVSLNKGIEREVARAGLKISRKNPDIVLCVGGDGTFLYGEQVYPGVPKLLIKHRCKSCKKHKFGQILDRLKKGAFTIKKEILIWVI